MARYYYSIPKQILDKVTAILRDHWFSDGGERNNDEVISITTELEEIIKEQDKNG